MTRLLSLVAITTTVSLGLLFAACSGSSGVTFLDASTTDSGQTGLGGDSGVTDSGNQCAPCEQQNPDPSACTTSDPCGCGPFTCADSGPSDSCTWGAVNTCGAGKYCSAPGCKAKGKCIAIPSATTETSTNNPQCGCDGVTYWNPTVAAVHGMSLSQKGECSGNDVVACSTATACAVGNCNIDAKSIQGCTTETAGTCWVLPTTCPGAAILGKDAKACNTVACIGECAAIKTNAPWYADTCGPIVAPQN